uniref:Uncharacterized protein n=1 Tax=mine drainage metagenome TaxID=410659 RepID=E6QKN2_9ZZZZ
MRRIIARAITEIGFIVFLFYSNLLMGEFDTSGPAHRHSLLWAMGDIFTESNLIIALIAALIGYLLVELLRKQLQ